MADRLIDELMMHQRPRVRQLQVGFDPSRNRAVGDQGAELGIERLQGIRTPRSSKTIYERLDRSIAFAGQIQDGLMKCDPSFRGERSCRIASFPPRVILQRSIDPLFKRRSEFVRIRPIPTGLFAKFLGIGCITGRGKQEAECEPEKREPAG